MTEVEGCMMCDIHHLTIVHIIYTRQIRTMWVEREQAVLNCCIAIAFTSEVSGHSIP